MTTPPVVHYDPNLPPACTPPPAPGPATTEKQVYQVAVPFSGSTLSMGVSAGRGGSGTSLTTSGSVLIDACGPVDLQSVGNLSVQTLGSLAAMSLSGTMVGTPAGIQIQAGAMIKAWAGAGKAPGACGTGGAAGAPGAPEPNAEGGPAAKAEKVVAVATAIPSVIAAGVTAATTSGIQRAAAIAGAVGTAGSATAEIAGKEPPAAVGAGNDALSAIAEAASGGGGVAGAIAGVAAAAGGAAAAAAGGGGATKVDIQGPTGVHMTTSNKIQGNAANAIEFKAGATWSAKVAGGIELQATAVSIFAAGKTELRGLVKAEVTSMGVVKVEAPVINVASMLLKVEGVSFHMKGATLRNTFKSRSMWDTPTMKFVGKLRVQNRTEVEGHSNYKADLKANGDLNVAGAATGNASASVTTSVTTPQAKASSSLSVTGAMTA